MENKLLLGYKIIGTVAMFSAVMVTIPPPQITLAVLFSIIADFCFYVWPNEYIVPVSLFASVHLIYMNHYGQHELFSFLTGFLVGLLFITGMLSILGRKWTNKLLLGFYSILLVTALYSHSIEGDRWYPLLGYILFALSDLFILISDILLITAIDRFIILFTYYTAQILLISGTNSENHTIPS